MKIVLDGILESVGTRADGTLKVVFGTQEIEPKQAGDLMGLTGKYSKLLLSDTNITQAEETAVDEAYIQGGKKKSKSGRLRSVMFVVWKNSGLKDQVTFENYYSAEMEKLIDVYKSKLEPADDASH